MGVQDPAAERLEHLRADDAHVAGEDHDLRIDGAERVREGLVIAGWDKRSVDPLLRRPVDRGTGSIRKHEDDVATEVASSRRGDQRAQVGAAARNADGDSGCGVAAQTATPSGAST
jgi:hypothetical protein